MRCPRCQHDNLTGTKFCGECAAPLASVCAACGAANPAENKFCGQCAAPRRKTADKFPSPQSSTPKHRPAEHADGHYRDALALAEELEMRPLVAHCHLGLGKLYARPGKRQQAQGHLTTATTMYRETDMQFWLEQAEAETRALP